MACTVPVIRWGPDTSSDKSADVPGVRPVATKALRSD